MQTRSSVCLGLLARNKKCLEYPARFDGIGEKHLAGNRQRVEQNPQLKKFIIHGAKKAHLQFSVDTQTVVVVLLGAFQRISKHLKAS